MLSKLLVIFLNILALLNKIIQVFPLNSPLSSNFECGQRITLAVYPVTNSIYGDLEHFSYFFNGQIELLQHTPLFANIIL